MFSIDSKAGNGPGDKARLLLAIAIDGLTMSYAYNIYNLLLAKSSIQKLV